MQNYNNINVKNPNQPAVSARYLKLFLQIAEEEGWEQNQLLNGLGVNISSLNETDYVNYSDIKQLIDNCRTLIQDSGTGLRIGEKLQCFSRGTLSHAIMEAPTHIEGLQVFKRFIRLRTGIVTFDINITEENIFLYFDCTQDLGNVNHFIIEAALAGTCSLTRYFSDIDPVVSVHFSYPKPENAQIYNDFFSIPIFYQCERNYITLKLDIMSRNTNNTNPKIHEAAINQRSTLISQLEKFSSMTEKVKHLLSNQLEYFFCQKDLADQLNMSTRSLRRRLRAENTSYQKVLDEVRCELAQNYLQIYFWTVDEIAEMLGYSETANFTRAFRRWTGKTPTQIRSYLIT